MDNSREDSILEVVELTTLMRSDPSFDHVRAVCQSVNSSPDELLLVQMIGGEDLFTTGVLLDPVAQRTWHFRVGDYSLEVQVDQVDGAVDLDGKNIEKDVIQAALSQL